MRSRYTLRCTNPVPLSHKSVRQPDKQVSPTTTLFGHSPQWLSSFFVGESCWENVSATTLKSLFFVAASLVWRDYYSLVVEFSSCPPWAEEYVWRTQPPFPATKAFEIQSLIAFFSCDSPFRHCLPVWIIPSPCRNLQFKLIWKSSWPIPSLRNNSNKKDRSVARPSPNLACDRHHCNPTC